MKLSKKIIALVCAICLLCSMVVFAGDSEENTDILLEYGIVLADERGEEEAFLTRAQMTKIVCRLLQLSKSANDVVLTENVFSDVTPDHPYARYISMAKSMGLICGYPDGSFLPQQEITACEVLKILLAALGYLPQAQEKGGYPHGILILSNQIALTKGISLETKSLVSMDTISSLVQNALDIPLMVQTGWGAFEEYQVNNELSLRKSLEKAAQ